MPNGIHKAIYIFDIPKGPNHAINLAPTSKEQIYTFLWCLLQNCLYVSYRQSLPPKV